MKISIDLNNPSPSTIFTKREYQLAKETPRYHFNANFTPILDKIY